MKDLSGELKKNMKKAFNEIPTDQRSNPTEFFKTMKDTEKMISSGELGEENDFLNLIDQIVKDESETTEATGAGSAGGYVGPMIIDKEETKEATTAGSSGSYDAPLGSPRKDPLKIDNPGLPKIKEDKIKIPNNVKGKNSKNRYGGPEGVFVKVKEKCKKYPYCDQGDINALEFYEDKDIYSKTMKMENIQNYIEKIVDKVLSENDLQEKDEMEEFYEIAKMRKEERMSKNDTEIKEKEMEEGNAFSGARCKAGCEGKKEFEVGGETHTLDDWSDEDRKNCNCEKMNESSNTLQLTEEELIDLIEKIVKEEKIEGVSQQNKSMKQSEKDNKDHYKEVTKKLSDYNKGYKDEAEKMPMTSGEIEKMEKVAYEPNEEAEEYIEDYSYGSGLTGLDYDGLEPDEERQKDYLEGSTKTGNSSEYANAVKTEVGEKFNDIRKKAAFAKNQKNKSYNKDTQPVEMVKESLETFKKIISHNYKSQ